MSSKFSSLSVQEHVKFCLDVRNRKVLDGEIFKERNTDDCEDLEEEEVGDSRKESVSSSANQSWDEKNVIFKNKRRIRRKRVKSSTSVGCSQGLIPVIGNTESDRAFKNKGETNLADDPKEVTKHSVVQKWKCGEKNWDVFSVVLWCHKRDKPAMELLEASVDLRSTLLAVIAACYDKNLKLNCLGAWLYSYIPQRVIKRINTGNLNNANLVIPSKLKDIMAKDYLERLMAFYLTYEHIDVLMEAFKIFDSDSLMIPLMEALKCAKGGGNIDDISRCLARVVGDSTGPLLQNLREEESSFVILATCQGIDFFLKNRILQQNFIEALLPFSEFFPFKSDAVNWNKLLQILEILGSINIPLEIFHFRPSAVVVDLHLVVTNLIKVMISIDNCDKAFQLANAVGMKIEDIFCCQIESEFESLRKTPSFNIKNMKDFLYETHFKVKEKEVNPESVALLFESLSKSVTSLTFSYLALQYSVIWIQLQLDQSKELPERELETLIEYSELLELEMWCKYIEACLVENLEQSLSNLVAPSMFENWPWEYGSNIQNLNYEFFVNNSFIKYKVQKKSNFEKFSKKYFKTLYAERRLEDLENVIKKEVEAMVQEMMKKDMLVTALRIEEHFGVMCEDASLMKNLLKKACEENLKPAITPSLHSWEVLESPDERPTNKIPALSLKSAGFSNLNSIEDMGSRWLKEICIIISDFSEYYYFSKRLLILCRIAEDLSITYIDLTTNKEILSLLIDLLTLERFENFQLSKELIEAYPIPQDDVSYLLYCELLSLISAGPFPLPSERQTSSFLSWETVDRKWPELLSSLTENPSSVGFYLMDSFRNLSKDSHPDCIAKIHVKCIETLIRAHDCFTQAANMEGINAVLTSAFSLTKGLLKHSQWTLMGRLLTGIKRYKEMSYIIDIMKEHQQFERLLGRTGEKVQSTDLDRTLLHFLYSNYPEEKEMLRMVASHFLMFSELAKMWEDEAERIMRIVLETSLHEKPHEESFSDKCSKGIFFLKKVEEDESPSTSAAPSRGVERSASSAEVDYLKNLDPSLLTEAIHCYCFASQYCIEEKQMMCALQHSRQAELIAVQLNLFKRSSGNLCVRVVKLTPSLLNLVMAQHLRVNELIIVARTYGINPDWASSLYFHFIKNGDVKFLEEFLQFCPMTQDIVLDIVKKVEKYGLEPYHKERMSKLLFYVSEADLIYKVASQLDLRAKAEQCLESKAACYLKDTVFSKGVAGSGRM